MKLKVNRKRKKVLLVLCLWFVFTACSSGGGDDNGEPALTGTVSITGTAQVGQTLTADISSLYGDGNPSYQWFRDNAVISGATGSFYILVEADQGKYIKVEVARGGYKGVITSNPKGPVAGSNAPALTGTVSVDGIGQVGQTLTANTSTLNGSGDLSYVWWRDNTQISGAVGSSYILVEADRGKFIKVEVSRSGYAGTVLSTSRGPIAGTNETPVNIIYAREYWGEWIRMDTGDKWYFNNETLAINGQTRSLTGTVTKQSTRVIQVKEGTREYYLYASRPATARFSGRVTDIRQTSGGQARAISLGGMNAIIQNIKNEADIIPVEITSTGEFNVPEIIAEDQYEINIPEVPEIPPVVVAAGYSGDNIGTINLAEGVNFKISIRAANPQTTDMTRLFADYSSYNMVIDIKNTGTENCTAATFDLDFGDLTFSPAVYDHVVGTIVPGATKSVNFTISDSPFSEIQPVKDKVIGITIRDIQGKTWNDSVQLQFNKAPVNFNIKSNNAVQGVILTPEQKAFYFKTAAPGYSTTVTLPWTTEPYLVVFSGATVDTESKYSLGINVMPDAEFLTFSNTAAYEPNNTEFQAYNMDIQTAPKIMSYLHLNDIDYYRVSLGSTPPETKPVSMVDYKLRENYSGEEAVKPGDSAWLDIRFRNNSTRNINPTLILSTTSSYITVENATRTLGTVNMQNYKTLSSSQSDQSDNAQFFTNNSTSNAFRFKVADNCPDNAQINFSLNYSEGATTWQETFTVIVQPRIRSVAIETPVSSYCVLEENGGNGDGVISPGENAFLKITIRNSEAEATAGLRAELSGFTNTQFTANTPTISALGAGSSAVVTFNLAVNANCPIGSIGPLTLTLTETSGKQRKWLDTVPAINIAVPIPTNVKAEALSETVVRVSWNQVTGASGYKVYDSNGTLIATINSGSTLNYEHTGRSAGTVLSYKVSAFIGSNESSQSATVSARTWEQIPYLNKSVNGTVSAGLPHYYRFYVIKGGSYAFTSSVSASVKYETGDTGWFTLDGYNYTTNQNAGQAGWAYIKFENAGAYTLKILNLEAGISAFSIDGYSGTVNEAEKTITAVVPYGTNLTSLTPSVTPASGWTCATTGAKNFTAPVEYVFTKGDAAQVYTVTVYVIINAAAIQGVTVPVSGAVPVTAVTETPQYTGTVTWSPNHATFAPSTTYTATITLTAKTGYTLQGVAANFFTVGGVTTVSNAVNSGSIKAVFPATATGTLAGRFEYYWVNQHDSLVTTSGGSLTTIPGETLTITAQSSGYTVQQWRLNGLNTGQSGNTYTFSSSVTGINTIGLFVEKDGKLYNTNITITVVPWAVVTFNVNGGTGTVPTSQPVLFSGSSITLPDGSGLTRTGYTFGGWNTNNSGTGTNYSAGSYYIPTDRSVTLYAKWNINRSITVVMYDSGGDGWDGGGALRINVNGVDIASNVKVESGYTNTYTFNVVGSDVVNVYWVAGTYQEENSFIVYYTNTPPSPAFTASNEGPTSWNGSNALVYKLRNTMNNITNNTLLGSFTVQ